MFLPPLAAPRRRLTSPPLSHRVLIAAELKNLLEPSQLADLDVTWLAADQPTPKGDWVAIVPLLSRWVGGTQLKHLPNLRIVANCAVGYNNVDVVAAEMRKVIVTNTPGVLTEATADLTWALILATARRLIDGVAPRTVARARAAGPDAGLVRGRADRPGGGAAGAALRPPDPLHGADGEARVRA